MVGGGGRGPRRGPRPRRRQHRCVRIRRRQRWPHAAGRLQHRRRRDRQRAPPRRGRVGAHRRRSWAAAAPRPQPSRRCKELGAASADVFVRDVSRAGGGPRGRPPPSASPSRCFPSPGRPPPSPRPTSSSPRCRPARPTHWPRSWQRDSAAGTAAAARACCWTSPTIPGPAGSPPPGRKPAARWSPDWRCCIYQAVEQVRHFTGLGEAVPAEVIDVMCDAVGAPRRVF